MNRNQKSSWELLILLWHVYKGFDSVYKDSSDPNNSTRKTVWKSISNLQPRRGKRELLRPGIEPGSSACEALVLTDIRTEPLREKREAFYKYIIRLNTR